MCVEVGRAHEPAALAEELLRAVSCWWRERQFSFFKGIAPGRLTMLQRMGPHPRIQIGLDELLKTTTQNKKKPQEDMKLEERFGRG